VTEITIYVKLAAIVRLTQEKLIVTALATNFKTNTLSPFSELGVIERKIKGLYFK